MRMKRATSLVSLLVMVASGLVGLSALPAHAQASDANAAQGLQISPAEVELDGDPGKSYIVNLNLTNVTGSELVYTSLIDDFKAKDETGTPEISVDTSLPKTASIRSWVSVPTSFNLMSHEARMIAATVTIPANAEPGGHYGVIEFAGSPPNVTQTGVGLSASAGTLMLITVSGDIVQKAALASFSTSNLAGSHHSFFEYGPISFITRINNTGNVHIAPQGTIELHNMFGGLVSTLKVNAATSNQLPGNVLPNSIRSFENTYNKTWMFGRYTADLTLGYGTTGGAITGQVSFWVIPYRFILITLLILVTAIFILSRLIRQYNRHIIEKAKKNESASKAKTAKNKKPKKKA
jgi:hypothetical protein